MSSTSVLYKLLWQLIVVPTATGVESGLDNAQKYHHCSYFLNIPDFQVIFHIFKARGKEKYIEF